MQDPLQQWFDAICLFTKPLVEDPDDDDGEALTLFAQQALAASNSKSAAVFMPTVGGNGIYVFLWFENLKGKE